MNKEKIKEICGIIEENIEKKHVGKLNGSEKELFLIGEAYPGVWLEHVYDSVMYAKLFPEKGKEIARNTVEFFIDRQTSHGQLPCYIFKRERFRQSIRRNGFVRSMEIGWREQNLWNIGMIFRDFMIRIWQMHLKNRH